MMQHEHITPRLRSPEPLWKWGSIKIMMMVTMMVIETTILLLLIMITIMLSS